MVADVETASRRVRIRFSKQGKIRFTSHRDVARMWERALRRAGLPLAYTEGFSPRPRLSFGLALPTGCESEAEYLDVSLDDRRTETTGLTVASLPEILSPLLPDGVEVREAAGFEPGSGSLQQLVTSCSWTMFLAGVSLEELTAQVGAFLAAPSVLVTRERKGRTVEDDVRPAVRSLAVVEGPPPGFVGPGGTEVCLEAELGTQPRGMRPSELMTGLASAQAASGGPSGRGSGGGSPTGSGGSSEPAGSPGDRGQAGAPVISRACRTHQWIERDGIRDEPLEWARRQDADRAGYALERAS